MLLLRGPGAGPDWAGPSEPPSAEKQTEFKYFRTCAFSNPYRLTGRVNQRHEVCMYGQYRAKQVSSASERGEE